MQEETTDEELDEITRPLKHIRENDVEEIELRLYGAPKGMIIEELKKMEGTHFG